MSIYKVRVSPLSGTDYHEVMKFARGIFTMLKSRTKRKMYIRSQYFKKQKVFFDYFWEHLFTKRHPDRVRRLKFLPCAIELIQKSTQKPEEKKSLENQKEIFYRFYGQTLDKKDFVVQIKKTKPRGTLQCISIFPVRD